MAYQALYRKYRPPTFDEMVGQSHIVRALKNQVESGRTGHAYLFSGPRGTGKTSAAKILARALTCHGPTRGQPCGECPACRDENPVDITEIDAASHNKVDDVRDMLENVRYLPALGKKRVYIIDEVHMLTPQAFNALLKTLEEPPEHVVFILATTEPHKLPATVLSRCQRFSFGRISVEDLTDNLRRIAQKEGIAIDEEALSAVAVAAEGGMRDAISLMDQCAALSPGQAITAAQVYAMLGTANREYYFTVAGSLLSGDAPAAVGALEGFLADGGSLQVFAQDLCRHLRDLYVAKTSPGEAPPVQNIDLPTWKRLLASAKAAVPGSILQALDILSQLDGTLRYTNNPRVMVELAIFRSCRVAAGGAEGLLTRLEQLEQQVTQLQQRPLASPAAVAASSVEEADGEPLPAALDDADEYVPPEAPPPDFDDAPPWAAPAGGPPPQAPPSRPIPASMPAAQTLPAAKAVPGPPKAAPAGANKDADALWKRTYDHLCSQGKDSVAAHMVHGKGIALADGVLTVQYPKDQSMSAEMLQMARRGKVLATALAQVAGQPVRVEYSIYQYSPEEQQMLEESIKRLPADIITIKN
ncbi:MAG: DNA polymerase III subunit gamma/tau [Eubacteriales bacterium]|nr:DNA polymerase III subunit gamma/tau [Eubacteriales bacterium]